jgi:hypothetical protein
MKTLVCIVLIVMVMIGWEKVIVSIVLIVDGVLIQMVMVLVLEVVCMDHYLKIVVVGIITDNACGVRNVVIKDQSTTIIPIGTHLGILTGGTGDGVVQEEDIEDTTEGDVLGDAEVV